MNIIVLEGSPNVHGSSNMLAEEFIRGAKETGHEVTVIDTAHANIHPCTGCMCGGEQDAFPEAMAEAGKSVSDCLGNGERIVKK